MVLSVSGVILLGIVVLLLFKKGGLKPSHALVCALFGFYLAGTSLAPGIRAGGAGLAGLLSGLRP